MTIDPSHWDKEHIAHLMRLSKRMITMEANPGSRLAATSSRSVVSTQHPLSAYAGLQVLQAGGNAVDALVTIVALEQVLMPGTSSLGGPMAVLYREAQGKTITLDAGLNMVRDDKKPYHHLDDRETGRAVLVPGMIAGLEALWKRYGSLPWQDLWSPAIFFAREGFPLYEMYAFNLQRRQSIVLRYPEGRAIYLNNGNLLQLGQQLQQPVLASTLEHLAKEGAAYAYQGAWAEQLVSAVQGLGGKMRMEDLIGYTVMWNEPTIGSYLGYEIQTTTMPLSGGPMLLTALNIAEALDLHHRPRRDHAALTLYDEIQAWKIASRRQTDLMVAPSLSKDYARSIAEEIRLGRPEVSEPTINLGSHQVAIIDVAGNMIAATHTIASDSWGDTGLFIGGIALNSSAYLRRSDGTGVSGMRVPLSLACYLVLQDHQPLFIAGAIGSGLLGCNLQNTINMLAHGDSAATSIAAKRWGYYNFNIQQMQTTNEVQVEPFDNALLDSVEQLGQPLVRSNYSGESITHRDTGYWAAAGFTGRVGERFAVTDPRLMGLALGE